MVWREVSRAVIGQPDVPPDPPDPPPPSGIRTMVASVALAKPLWGFSGTEPICPTPDFMQNNVNASSLVGTGGWIDVATTAGACFIINPIGGNGQTKTADGSFSTALWIDKFDLWWDAVQAITGGDAKLRTAVRDNVLRAINVLDDFTTGVGDDALTKNSYRNPVSFAEIETICGHAKTTANWLPLVARGPASILKRRWSEKGGGAKYTKLDAGWAQVRPRYESVTPTAYFVGEVTAGTDVDLGLVSGINLRMGEGTDAWGCWPMPAVGSNLRCGVSPTEMTDWGGGAMANTAIHGFVVWAYSFETEYWKLPEIQAAMNSVYTASVGRTEGPINVRGDLGVP